MAVLTVEGIQKSFSGVDVLRDISFSLEQGETVAVIGASGSGKTTLLRCLTYLEKADKGTVAINGQTVFDAASQHKLTDSELRDFVEKMKIKLKYDEQEQRHLTLTDADWEEIELFLERVDDKFVSKLQSRFPQLTINDKRLLFLLRLRLSTKTIAEIFKISEKSIKQKLYLYKKKLGVEGESLSLRKFIENF